MAITFSRMPTEAEMAAVSAGVDAAVDAQLRHVAGKYWEGLTELPDVGLGESAAGALAAHLFTLLWLCREDGRVAIDAPSAGSVDVEAIYRGFLLRQLVAWLRAGLPLEFREGVLLPVLAKMWRTETAQLARNGAFSKKVESAAARFLPKPHTDADAGFDTIVGELIRGENDAQP